MPSVCERVSRGWFSSASPFLDLNEQLSSWPALLLRLEQFEQQRKERDTERSTFWDFCVSFFLFFPRRFSSQISTTRFAAFREGRGKNISGKMIVMQDATAVELGPPEKIYLSGYNAGS